MEDKELQELFAAKRTVEANRRRQEELRRLLEASATPAVAPKSRRLWPLWLGAAAAAVLLLLLATPVLFRQSETAPIQLAKNTEPTHRVSRPLVPSLREGWPKAGVCKGEPKGQGGATTESTTKATKNTPEASKTTKAENYAEIIDAAPEDTFPHPALRAPLPQGGDEEKAALAAIEPTLNTEHLTLNTEHLTLNTEHLTLNTERPTVHRRTSSSMVCSNCNITNVPTPNTALQNFLVATFGAEARPPLTLTNIEF
jgi:hypothetical protein